MRLVTNRMEIRVLGKGRNALVAIKKDISVETRSVQRVTELAECAVLLAILKLHAPGLVSVVVVIPDPEGIKVTKVLMVDGERLGADEVAVEYDFVRAVVESCVPVALSPEEIEEASYNDEELCLVKNCVKSGNWQKCTIPSYAHVKDELCTYGEILLRGTRIVVPKVLRDKVVRLAHEGHQGVVKTKCRLRSKVWWPGMDKDVENLCKICHGCQVTSSCDPPDPMSRV